VPSILPSSVNDCCSTCCEVDIVDLPSGGGTGECCVAYDSMEVLRQESRAAILVDDTSATVYGLLARGDGRGGGFYYFDGASIDADDGISTIKPNSIAIGDPGRWKKWLG